MTDKSPAPSSPQTPQVHGKCPICRICGSLLETYTIHGGIWLGVGKGFDTTPQVKQACPKCDSPMPDDSSPKQKLKNLMPSVPERIREVVASTLAHQDLVLDGEWCPDCGDPREACLCPKKTEPAEASPKPAGSPYIWQCIGCGMRVSTQQDFHINERPICVQCNAEMVPERATSSPALKSRLNQWQG